MVVVGGEFGCGGGGCWPMAWWWQGGRFHVVVLAIVFGFGGGGNRHGLMVGFPSIFCFGIVVVIC